MAFATDQGGKGIFPGICLMENCAMHYAWGSRTEIPRLLGEAGPSREPLAELWMGAHVKAPSRLRVGQVSLGLDGLIKAHPEEILGPVVSRRFNGELPFLLKVLAAGEPLSIQVHPDQRQASEGFEREHESGLPVDAPDRCFRDRHHKPELLVALTPFEGLKGFRPGSEIASLFDRLESAVFAPLIEPLRRSPRPEDLSVFFRALLGLPHGHRKAFLGDVFARVRNLADQDPVFGWVRRLGERYPMDMSVLAPLFMNFVQLQPGEGIFIAPGELHGYLRGTGIEIMANSDNVLRAGLTDKRVDLEGVMTVLRFEPGAVEVLRARSARSMEWVFGSPAEEFELSVIRVGHGEAYRALEDRSVEILLCLEGEAVILGAANGEAVTVPRGSSVMVAATAPAYTIRGAATIYKACVPLSPLC